MYLHVLQGQQTGSTIELNSEQLYAVSSDFDQDIYINSESTFHFEFIIRDGQVYFSNISGINLNGPNNTPITENIAYPAELVVNLNDLLGKLAATLLISASSTPTEQPASIEDLFPDPETDPLNNEFLAELKEKSAEVVLPWYYRYWLKAKPYLLKAWAFAKVLWFKLYDKIGYWAYVLVAFVLIFVISISAIMIQLEQQEKEEYQLAQIAKTRRELQYTILNLPSKFSNLRLIQQGNGFVVSGIVETPAQSVQLHQVLNKFRNIAISYNIAYFSDIRPALLQIMQQNNILNAKVSFNPENGFSITISGLTEDMNNVDNAEIEIHNKFGYLGQIDTAKIFFSKDVDVFFDKLPEEVKDQLSITKNYAKGNIAINGILTKTQIDTLNDEVDQFNEAYAGVLMINLNIKDVLKDIPFYITEAYTGPSPWIITNDGTTLYPGGIYKGITVVAIEPNKVTLKSTFTFSLSMNELMNLAISYNSNSNVNHNNGTCDRDCIIKGEQAKQQQLMAKEAKQLQELQQIVKSSQNKTLQADLNDTIKNLENDLNSRKAEYNYYNKAQQ